MIKFNQKPYQVVYKDFHTNELKTVNRRPAEKQHLILPTDKVELTQKKNDDFEEGEEFTVKHISYRAPNVLQLKNDDNQTTFVNYFDTNLVEEVAYRNKPRIDDEDSNRYLIWP